MSDDIDDDEFPDDEKPTLWDCVVAEVERRNKRTDGYVTQNSVREAVEVVRAEYLKVPQRFTEDPAEQRRLGIMIDEIFQELEEEVEKWLEALP